MDAVIEACEVVIKIVVLTIIGAVKAILPVGTLKRKSVRGDVVLITGSASGIGRILARKFGKLGARVVLWDVNETGNEETKRVLEDEGIEAHIYKVDLAKRKEIYAAAERVKADIGNVDILINNAGVVNGKRLMDCPDELIELTMAVNANALFFTIKSFLPHMLETNHGHIVTVASMAGKGGLPGLVDYCASKHAAIGLSDSLRSEIMAMKKDGVHVTNFCPFYINTGMFEGAKTRFPSMFPILEPEYAAEQLMEAVLTNKEIICVPRLAYVALFLASFLPSSAIHVLFDYFGFYSSMEDFTGRTKVELH